MSSRRIFARPARFAAIAPYVWMVLFFLVPFGFVLKISLSQTAIAQPPYEPLFDLTAGWEALKAAFAALTNCASPRSVAARRSKKVSEIIGRRETGDGKPEARE